ncbi:alcohol dehydrogenase catalytic domain-containing protein [Streptomyces cavernicola]|uniref:Alcohol dehydrogenase catalytic domain-containing protein n=1 Tax=Streptomyces cavernicola TaxID=3043613 RepID=A0ABT6SCN9_9ACTN|nr:zinc-binding dehydrogenase [Streptomyces sp. B-S-A6]MDI3405734.1 alcohol dehydrogenase catalytic domain-containing protein [Streptomyces sp. B-S-A6]
MRAVQYLEGTFTLADVPELPALGPGQLRIDVAACGICGSDLTVSKDPCRFVQVVEGADYRLAQFDPQRPIVLGHEFAGTVAETGTAVTDFAVGDRVAGLGIVTDTSTGIPKIIGYSNEYHGAFGEQIVVDHMWARHIPDQLSLEHAALAEPLHVGELHVQRSGLTSADSALVIGCGTIGLGAIIAAKARGARTVIASEPSPKRRELALKMGADHAVDPNEQDPIELYASLAAGGTADGTTTGGGILVAYECSGRPGMIGRLLHELPYDSLIQVLAAPFADETIIPVVGQLRRIAINFGHGPTDGAYETVLRRLADGEIDADAIITGRVGLDGVADAFTALRNPEEHVKIMVVP